MQDFDVWLQALPTTFLEMESSRYKDLKSERDRSNFGVFFLCLASSRLPTLDPPWCRCGSPRGISFLSSFPPSLLQALERGPPHGY